MKVKAIKKGYYDNKIRKVGEIFECKEKKIPTWTTLADGIENGKSSKGSKTPQAPQKQNTPQKVETPQNPQGTAENKNDGNKEVVNQENQPQILNDDEKKQYLELLINEAIDKNILIEDADKKTVDEQILELEGKLGKERK